MTCLFLKKTKPCESECFSVLSRRRAEKSTVVNKAAADLNSACCCLIHNDTNEKKHKEGKNKVVINSEREIVFLRQSSKSRWEEVGHS